MPSDEDNCTQQKHTWGIATSEHLSPPLSKKCIQRSCHWHHGHLRKLQIDLKSPPPLIWLRYCMVCVSRPLEESLCINWYTARSVWNKITYYSIYLQHVENNQRKLSAELPMATRLPRGRATFPSSCPKPIPFLPTKHGLSICCRILQV